MTKRLLPALAAAALTLWSVPALAVSSFTSCYTLENPATGDQTNTWGTTENTGRSIVDQALAGNVTVSASSGGAIALSDSQGAVSQAKNSQFTFTGALPNNTTILWPNGRCRFFSATNSTSGAFSLTLCVNNGSSGCAGGSVVIPQGQTMELYSDGTNVLPRFTLPAHAVALGEGTAPLSSVTPGLTGQVLTSNGASSDPTFQAVAPALRDYIADLVLSNDSTSPSTVIDTAVGDATSDDATMLMVLTSAITKSTGSWVAGNGNGCLDTGSVTSNTWYHVFLIERTDTSVVDELCSTSVTSPAMPANYTKKRRIGSFRTAAASTNILAFTQQDDAFYWSVPEPDFVQAIGFNSPTNATISVPSGVRVRPIMVVGISGPPSAVGLGVDVYDPTMADHSPVVGMVLASENNGSTTTIGVQSVVSSTYSNTSSQIRLRAGSTSVQVSITTLGWFDPRGQNQ